MPSKRLVTLEGPKVSLTLPGTQDELAGDDEAREIYENKLGKVKVQKLPCGQEILEADGTTLLGTELAGLYRSLVGCGIYLSPERLDVAYTVKELASTMSCPTSASLKKLGKLIGYLKHTIGQYNMRELNESGQGLVVQEHETRWLLETFSDSDWSGAKGHRRSTSAAIHMVNGVVVAASSRSQKSVSLSSAEAELNLLVSSAADGIYLRRCLEFLTVGEVKHCCLVDNAAALHLCHRKGPGRLRHVSGKLLWIQDAVLQEVLSVKPVGTVKNVADLGAKPLSKARVSLILNWCNVYGAGHERVGQEERVRSEMELVSKAKVNKLAKLLNRILLLEGLEHVAGMTSTESSGQCSIENTMSLETTSTGKLWVIWSFIVLMMMMVVALGCLVIATRRELRRAKKEAAILKDEMIEIQESQKVDGVVISSVENELRDETKNIMVYMQKIHRGLVKVNGYVDETEFKDCEWRHWDYLQKSNKTLDYAKLKGEARAYLMKELDRHTRMEQTARGEGDQDVPMEGEGVLQPGGTAQVWLDSGEVVDIP